nr:MAG TPA: hypothetical protein [Microviridae sp.]
MKVKWKKVVEFAIALLTLIGSFLGGQASAQNGVIDIFNKHSKIEHHGRI